MTALEEINDMNFEQEVLGSTRLFLVSFSAPWCGPCKRQVPILQALAQQARGQVRIGRIDMDSSPLTTQKLGVRGAPTLVFFRNGSEFARRLGLTSQSKLRQLVLDQVEQQLLR